MDLMSMIGQRMVTGFPAYSMSEEFIQTVKKYKLSNVILFKRNIKDGAQLKQLCADIQTLVMEETGYPAFITLDQEGGTVTRLNDDVVNAPGTMTIAATGNTQYAYDAGLMTGQELLELGVNFNLAPDLDVNSNIHNPVIGVRSFSDDANTVAQFGVRQIRGLQDGHVLSCAKHFPGHGDTEVDSHVGLPVIDKSYEQLKSVELVPFQAAIEENIPAIMTTHILFPQIEKNHLPATMSRTIMTDILRKKMGFQGLIISDCMMMDAIQKHYGTVNGVVSAMSAGVDLVFVCHDPLLAQQAMDAVYAGVKNGTISETEMVESANRILKEKNNLHPVPKRIMHGYDEQNFKKAQTIVDQSITLIKGEVPNVDQDTLFVSFPVHAASFASDAKMPCGHFATEMGEKFGCAHIVLPIDPTQKDVEKVLALSEGKKHVVVGTVHLLRHDGQKDVLNALVHAQKNVTACALCSPYDAVRFENLQNALCAYEYNSKALSAFYRVLKGELSPVGQLPVRI